jgi:hypothetical protein
MPTWLQSPGIKEQMATDMASVVFRSLRRRGLGAQMNHQAHYLDN